MNKKIVKASLIGLASVLLMSGCNGGTSSGEKTAAAKLVGAYSCAAKMTYQNMRPTYNYYLTTFTFETIEIYDDASYVLNVSSSTFSAVILPETGNDGQGNERTNYLRTYKGTYTATADAFDPKVSNYALSIPTSLLEVFDQQYFVDTSNWDDAAKERTKVGQGEIDKTTGKTNVTHYDYYASGAEYLNGVTVSDGDVLPGHSYAAFNVDLDSSNYSFTYVDLK